MKNIEEYDKHLQDFYAQSFRDYALKYDMSGAERYANDMLQSYGDAINNTLAQELLKNLNIQFPKLEDKLENYPSLFWRSKEAKELLRETMYEFKNNEVDYLYNKQDLNTEDIKKSFKKTLELAFKISVKKEKEAVDLLKNFQVGITHMLDYKVQHNQMDETTAKQLNENVIKQSLNHKELENYHKAHPEMAHYLGSLLYSVTTDEERKNERQNRRTLKVN